MNEIIPKGREIHIGIPKQFHRVGFEKNEIIISSLFQLSI